jgi:1-acyl-sn-glycerol-3-phosphate acyltransferase
MLFLRFIRALCRCFLFFVGTTEYIGREHIPAGQPFIFVFNHMSVVDSLLIIAGLPAMRMRIFIGPGWRKAPIVAQVAERFGGIFLDKGAERKSLRIALQSLADGVPLGLAPEGTLSKERALMRAKDGAAYVALKAQTAILPAGITGSEQVRSNLSRLRRSRFSVRFGPVFTLPETEARPISGRLPAYTHLIMVHIAALLPERYHGAYRDSPALQALGRGEDPWPYCAEAERRLIGHHQQRAGEFA